jgi:hypothetical protein
MDEAPFDERIDETDAGADAGVGDPMFDLGGDERRMHVRAYNHWVSLLKGRPYPTMEDLDPASIADFGQNSVLLDFSDGLDDPRIAFLGRALKEECGLDGGIQRIGEVPSRSLLSRLTDHYLQIIANRAPIGFEAEFVSTRGRNTMYRGILMPFSSDGDCIDFIYGVINWKELVDAATQAALDAELAADLTDARAAPSGSDAPVWADGPAADRGGSPRDAGTLDHQLAVARESAAAVRAADTRSRAALYRALGRAHDFGLAAEADGDAYRTLLGNAGLKTQARAPMTPIVKLVFGADYDKTRVTEFAAVLDHARRHAVATGALPQFLELHRGGIKAVVAAERAQRKPAVTVDLYEQARAELRARPVLAQLAMPLAGSDEFVVLLARRDGDGLSVLAQVEGGLVQQAVRRAAA